MTKAVLSILRQSPMISAEIAVSGYILPPPELPRIPPQIEVPTGILRILAQMASVIAKSRELLNAQSEKFETLFQAIEKRADKTDAEEIERMAEAVLGQRRNHAPALIAAVEALDEHVPDLSGPVLRLVEEGIDIGQTWLELYTNLHIRLIKLAADQRAKTGEGSPVFSEPDAAERYLRGVLSE